MCKRFAIVRIFSCRSLRWHPFPSGLLPQLSFIPAESENGENTAKYLVNHQKSSTFADRLCPTN